MAVDKKTLTRDALKRVRAGELNKAVETYKAIIKIDPRDASVHNLLGDLLGQAGKKEGSDRRVLRGRRGFRRRTASRCRADRRVHEEGDATSTAI